MRLTALCLLFLLTASAARGDWVEFQIPRTSLIATLEVRKVGKTQAGGIVLIQHDLGTLWIPRRNIRRKITTPSTRRKYYDLYNHGKSKKDAEELITAANWALRHGLIKEFHKAIDEAIAINSTHPEAMRVIAMRKLIDVPCPENSKLRKDMRKLVRTKGMEFEASKHFLLYHNMPQRSPRGLTDQERRKWKPRSTKRLELLERVYETFLYRFHSKGVKLEIPQDRLKVVLFKEHKQYAAFTDPLGPGMRSTAGFWEHTTNTAVFFDQGTHPSFKELLTLETALKKLAKADRSLTNLYKTIHLVVEIEKENMDVEVVSHEATHQLAGNTGLLPRHVMIPSWVHEGLATYFESPKDASWAGFGAVNGERLEYFRALETDRMHSNIDFIVGDQIFTFANTNGEVMHGYAQAWGLTHYLMENHFDKFMAFYGKLGELPPDVPISAEVLTTVFKSVFGENTKALDDEWHAAMRLLETEREKLFSDD